MAALDPHIFDIPCELIFEIIKKLDTKSIKHLSATCKYFKAKVAEFSDLFSDWMATKAAQERAKPACYSSSSSDWGDWEGRSYDSVTDHSDLFDDHLSMGGFSLGYLDGDSDDYLLDYANRD